MKTSSGTWFNSPGCDGKFGNKGFLGYFDLNVPGQGKPWRSGVIGSAGRSFFSFVMTSPAMDLRVKHNRQAKLSDLLKLSHELGCEDRQMAILGEGNTSARLGQATFLIKASGRSLRTLRKGEVVECHARPLLELLGRRFVSEEEIEKVLLSSRVDPEGRKPSVEALFHAFFLSLPDVEYVGHAHPIAVNQLLCSPHAREFAEKRIFPDHIVCCGSSSVFVPYTNPGFKLAREIRRRTHAYMKRRKHLPRMILMENHGIVTIGKTPQAVLAAMLMAEKAASIWVGAASLGGPVFLSRRDVHRIANRSDEFYRQSALKI